MRRWLRLLLLMTAVATVAAGCSTGSDAVNQQNGGQNGYQAGSGESQVFTPANRKPAPKVTGELLSGGSFTLSSLRGHVVVVNYWASWCNPCAAEAPDMEKVYRQTKGGGVRFLGVNIRDQHDAATAFERGRDLTYPSLFDPPGKVALAFRAVPPNTIPATMILDKQGRIAVVWRKAVLADDLLAMVKKVQRER